MEHRYTFDFAVIGRRIANGRKVLGITQKELAERIHITTNQIAKMETNRTSASLETIINIVNALQTDINTLLMNDKTAQTDDYIDLLINSQLKDFSVREKEALLLVMNAMRVCKSDTN